MRLRLSFLAALLLPAAASAYEVKTASSGSPLRWAPGPVPVWVGLQDDLLVSGQAHAAAVAAMHTFDAQFDRMGSEILVEDATDQGQEASPVGIRWITSGWNDDYQPEALAVTVTSYDPRDGRIQHASIVVNAELHRWAADGPDGMDGCEGAFDLQTVLTHEMGHMLGLGHSALPEATMFPSVGACSAGKRRLADDDVRALEFLYLETVLPTTPQVVDCSVGMGGGTTARDASILLVLAAFVLLRRRFGFVPLALVGLVSATAGATTLRRLSLEDLGRNAEIVARGTVVAVAPTLVDDRVYTDAHVLVTECWKGACGDRLLVVRQLGGEVAGAGTAVEGTTRFSPGNEVVLFLRQRSDGTVTPVGMGQGRFSVTRDRGGKASEVVRDLRELELVGAGATVERMTPESLRQTIRRQD